MINWNSLEQYIKLKMKQNHIAGTALAVSQQGKIIYQNGFGLSDLTTKQPISPETIFGTASITKSFVAASIVQLQKQNKLSVSDSVSKYIPELTIFKQRNEPTLIHHLLSHTTGLPPIERKEQLTTFDGHITYLNSLQIKWLGKPGHYFSYSNDCFLLLGLIIERVTGLTYRQYITEQFFERYGMNHSTFYLKDLSKFDHVTTPYTYEEKDKEYIVEKWPELGNYAVGGGVRSTVLDLLKYGAHYLGRYRRDISSMWSPVVSVKPQEYYGYGLSIIPNYNGVTLVRHGGGQPGVSSYFGFIPEKDIVISVLTNVTGVPVGDLWLATVNTILGMRTDQSIDIGESRRLNTREGDAFTGYYTCDEGYSILVKHNNDRVVGLIEDKEYELEKLDDHTLIVKEDKVILPFYFDNKKQAWAVRYGMRMLRKVTT